MTRTRSLSSAQPTTSADRNLYVWFMPSYELIAVPSVLEGIEIIRDRYPDAHYGHTWQACPSGESLPVWENLAANLRFELGERGDEHKPVAYVHRTRLRLE